MKPTSTMHDSTAEQVREDACAKEPAIDAAQVEADLQAFESSAQATPGRLNGWRFNRDAANERAEDPPER